MAALNFQLPGEGLKALGIHGQVFLNGGSSTLLSSEGRVARAGVRELASTFRWTVVSGRGE